MALVRKIRIHRKESHLHTRLELRDERAYFRGVFKWLAPVYVAFSLVDAITTGVSLVEIIAFRLAVVLLSLTLFVFFRGRVRYGARLLMSTFPYVAGVEFVMIKYSLTSSPYFSGFGLVLFGSSIFFPLPVRIALINYAICILPVCGWYVMHPLPTLVENMNLLLMTFGTAGACAVNAGQLNSDLRRRLVAQEVLARDLGQRQMEVWRKANELIKRKTFESQFSPQVVTAVLKQGASALEMRKQDIVAIVIDIEDSTAKAQTLEPLAYKTVVEEVFDVFSSVCLRWDITIDKFTGDGAQAFAGAPVGASNDLYRALMASGDTLKMLEVRRFVLRKRWKGPLNVRMAVCEGSALVGFLGRGSLKSFTALGEAVSFTHRLCAAGDPGKILCYSLTKGSAPEPPTLGWEVERRIVTHLKGFSGMSYPVASLRPTADDSYLVDNGRCPTCETPLILDDSVNGLPSLICPGCISRRIPSAA